MEDLSIFCADVGSVAAGNFGWASVIDGSATLDKSIQRLVESVSDELHRGRRVALGFESPLFVPLRDAPERLTSRRDGEGGRPWSAGAGCASLATGLAQVAWVLRRLRTLHPEDRATLRWPALSRGDAELLLWEAFVSGGSNAVGDGSLHAVDAERAARAFAGAMPNPPAANAIHEPDVYSLVGAALLRTGWREDLGVLAESCLVIRASKARVVEAP